MKILDPRLSKAVTVELNREGFLIEVAYTLHIASVP
jgi:hypothetical protein